MPPQKRRVSNSATRKRALRHGYRSGLEETVAKQIKSAGLKVTYEDKEHTVKFVQPEKNRTYLPDFVLPNGIIIETKGRFTTEDRQKHLWIKQQYGDTLDIRFVFSRSAQKLYKGSKSTYASWCDKHGFKYADKLIPEEWLNE